MSNKRDLKAYVRFDGSGRIVAGSLVLRRSKPKVGKWQEITAYECCNSTTSTTSSTTSSTTTVFQGYYTWLAGKNVDALSACAEPTAPVYSAVSLLTFGVILYEDTALTVPAAISWYATGGKAYEVNGSGAIVSETLCSQ